MRGSDAVVGVDLGTSAVKVLAVTTAGQEIAQGSEFYGLQTPQPDYVEQDADAVYRATMRVLARVLADTRSRGSDVIAIGCSSAMHGLVAVDENGEPLARLITWMDRRAASIADAWRADGTALDLYARTGAPMHPMLPLAKIRWLAENDREIFTRAHRFVGLKELFIYRWTGEWLVDWGLASATGMFSLERPEWDERALELAGIAPNRLSTPAKPTTILRAFRGSIGRELNLGPETAVVLASSDGALANIGIGASLKGDLALTLGTSGAIRVLTDGPALDTQGRTFCYYADDTRYIVGGPTSSAGASLDWISALLLAEIPKEQRFARAAELAEGIAPGANGLVVLPFLSGERAPYWRGSLRGAFDGLDLSHDRATILRAGFESIVFGLNAVYDVVKSTAGEAQRLLLSGGLTKAPLVRTLLADIFGLPAVQPRQAEASAFGAALVAAHALGAIADPMIVARESGYDAPTLPRPDRQIVYRDAYARYGAFVEAHLALYG
ncbi:MAG: gluconokinase [Candidatus Velthaea sp.]